MTESTSFAVTAMWIYPVKDEPGIPLSTVEIEVDGLAGDRRKKAALHLVSAADAAADGAADGAGGDAEVAPRANVVVDATAEQLESLITERMTIGTSEIEITGKPSNCPGVYASVVRTGSVNIGDRLERSDG